LKVRPIRHLAAALGGLALLVSSWTGIAAAISPATSSVVLGTHLVVGDVLTSSNGLYLAGLRANGDLTVVTSTGYGVWSAGAAGRGGVSIDFLANGNLVITSSTGSTTWTSGTPDRHATVLTLGDDGNLVIFAGSTPLWSTRTGAVNARTPSTLYVGGTLASGASLLSPGGLFRLTMQTDGNLVIAGYGGAFWQTGTWGHPGSKLIEQANGNLAVIMPSGWSSWQSGTWSGIGDHLSLQDDGNAGEWGPRGLLWSAVTGNVPYAPQSPYVAIFGDSLTAQAYPYFSASLSAQPYPFVYYFHGAYGGTAICSWFDQMRWTAGIFRSNVVILQFAGNLTTCTQGVEPYGPAAWNALYQANLMSAINIFLSSGTTHVVVVGSPTIRSDTSGSNALIRASQASTVSTLSDPRVTYLDGGAWVDDPTTGGYTDFRICASLEIFLGNCTGPVINGLRDNVVRGPDGVHFCATTLQVCLGYASGAWRFGAFEASAVWSIYGLPPIPPPITR